MIMLGRLLNKLTISLIDPPFAARTWQSLRTKYANTVVKLGARMVSHAADIYRFD